MKISVDNEAWKAIHAQQHFPVELYPRDQETGILTRRPEPQEWILEMKTAQEEENEKEEAFFENLRNQNRSEAINELRDQMLVLKKSNRVGISGQSQLKQKAAKSFVARLKKIQEKKEDMEQEEQQKKKKRQAV